MESEAPLNKDLSQVEMFYQLIEGNTNNVLYKNLVCLNAGAGFHVIGKTISIDEGARLAEELLQSGSVKTKFEQFRRAYAKLSG